MESGKFRDIPLLQKLSLEHSRVKNIQEIEFFFLKACQNLEDFSVKALNPTRKYPRNHDNDGGYGFEGGYYGDSDEYDIFSEGDEESDDEYNDADGVHAEDEEALQTYPKMKRLKFSFCWFSPWY